jgi:hypothetical protein
VYNLFLFVGLSGLPGLTRVFCRVARWQLAAVFSMQGVGRVFCATMLLVAAFTIKDTNMQWRFALVMGIVPLLAAIYFRW